MRNLFVKATMMVVLAFVAVSASAQESRVINGMTLHTDEWSEASIKGYLTEHSKDTLRVVNRIEVFDSSTKYYVSKYFVGSDGRFKMANDTLVVREVYLDEEDLYQKQLDTRVVESLYDDRFRDTYYAYVDGLKGVSDDDKDAGKIVLKSADKYGWDLGVYAGCQVSPELVSPITGVGVRFSQPYWSVGLNAEYGWSKFTEYALNAGERYNTYRTELILGVRPVKIDVFDQHRLIAFAGLGFEYYGTNSAPVIEGNYETFITSWGNYLYPTAGIRYEYRFFATGNSLAVDFGWRYHRGIIRDANPITNSSFYGRVSFNIGLYKNKEKYISNKQIRALKSFK